QFDPAGNCTKEQVTKEEAISYQYNARGQPLLISYPDSTSEQFWYGAAGDLVKSENRQKASFEYKNDPLFRTIGVTKKSDAIKESFTIRYEGRHPVCIEKSQKPQNSRVTLKYNKRGFLVKMTGED